ncbi:MAG TPA: 16S rRNA (cytosine(1402)-N(4))-methyltransferase RsmH [Candidatus Polarisedimenticolaceae bacterium]
MSAAALALASEAVVDQAPRHRSVLLREVVAWLRPTPGGTYIDCTLGAGGHAEALLEACAPDGRVLGLDRDPAALELARRRLAPFGARFTAVHAEHADLLEAVRGAGVFAADGILADLGVSSMQLDDAERGFSFRNDGPLDMRMDPGSGAPTAADLLLSLPEAEIRRILRVYGEERLASRIAHAIARRRESEPLRRTADLADLARRAYGPAAHRSRIHPATRTFQALRIAVNHEIDGLERFVTDAVSLLRRGGRFVAISFHSLEDRAVKHTLRALAERCICPPGLPTCGCGRENLVRILTAKPVEPSPEEIDSNPRARSARLRAAERR